VTAVAETGKPQLRVPAYLNQAERRLKLMISVYQRDQIVHIVIEEMDVDS
jgi:hypothetical protein